MRTYRVSDGNGEVNITAESARKACLDFVSGGDWGESQKTQWVKVTATEIIDPRYDSSVVERYDFLRDLRNAVPESRCPEVDLTDMSTSDLDAVCAYLRADDGSLSDGDQELCHEIADAIEGLDAPEPESESFTIEIPPTEPECCGGEHVWASPHRILGGLRENPGVQGKCGGVVITEVCQHCGVYRITDTWAQNPETGEQGLESVEYRPPDSDSKYWVSSMKGHRQ